ncbi:acyl-CoA--sterol O-acyltransferase 1-like [Silene latifolia]|uniref:acyl-CoA--sterol O-acyltransferase 1-like n=1 Tax=Silene latifolia TaxID=37657 RepID=UPI003D78A6A0
MTDSSTLELAEDEVQNFIMVWATVFVSLTYCYIISKITQKGFTRLLAILPIIALFLSLPLKLTSFHLGGTTAFFIAWLANFKILLFAFGQGPLCSLPTISFPLFLALACFPIRIQQDPSPKTSQKSQNGTNPVHNSQNKNDPDQKTAQKPQKKSLWNYLIKAVLLALIIKIYDYNELIHPNVLWFIFCFHMYFFLELALSLFAAVVKYFSGCEIEPPFDEPLLSSSLQDFWGRRWNIMVTRILRPSVYLPTLNLSSKVIGREWASLPSVMATFLVSALMHELIFYYLGRITPTFDVTWFFLLHGFCLCVEVAIKKAVGRKWRVPRWISGPATVAFVVATGFWLFLPPLVRAGLDTRPFEEFAAGGKFVRSVKHALSFQ